MEYKSSGFIISQNTMVKLKFAAKNKWDAILHWIFKLNKNSHFKILYYEIFVRQFLFILTFPCKKIQYYFCHSALSNTDNWQRTLYLFADSVISRQLAFCQSMFVTLKCEIDTTPLLAIGMKIKILVKTQKQEHHFHLNVRIQLYEANRH